METGRERERPLRVPHPEHEQKPVTDQAISAPSAQFSGTTVGNWQGLSAGAGGGGTYIPPDTNGAVGTTQYVQWVNAAYAVYPKSGGLMQAVVKGNALWKPFATSSTAAGCAKNNDGDPIVQFDKLANRWVMTQFSVSTKPYLQCVAVSTSDDFLTTRWNLYAFSYKNFPDYPKLAVWPDAYYITFNMFNGVFVGPTVCAYDRSNMLQGNSASQVCFSLGNTYASLLPADFEGCDPLLITCPSNQTGLPPSGSPGYLVSLGSGTCTTSSGCLNFWRFKVNFTTPSSSSLTRTTLSVSQFNRACGGGACVPQHGVTQKLDSLGDRLMYRVVYRNFGAYESIVLNHSVNANSVVGIRWYELRNATNSTLISAWPVIYQQGTYAPDSDYRWMGSIAMDKKGNIGVGYSASGSSYPSIRVAGQSGPATSQNLNAALSSEVIVHQGTGSQTQYSRWGDYSSLMVDPVDGCTFYYTTEDLPGTAVFNWNTWIYSFTLNGCQ
jgi:hypothetical protein